MTFLYRLAGGVVLLLIALTAQAVKPNFAEVAYAPADPAGSEGHLLDIYLPEKAARPAPVVFWSAGSG